MKIKAFFGIFLLFTILTLTSCRETVEEEQEVPVEEVERSIDEQ